MTEGELLPNLPRIWDRENLAAWLALRPRVPGERPPADRDQWAAWSRGESTTGPRYLGVVGDELLQRWTERRRPRVVTVPPLAFVGPWADTYPYGYRYGQQLPGRCLIRNGRTLRSPLVWLSPEYGGWFRASWARLEGFEPAKVRERGELAARAAVDRVLTAARIMLP